MVIMDEIKVSEKELEQIGELVENHEYHKLRKGVLIFRNIYTGEITIENQTVSFEDNGGMMFRRDRDEELLWWYERFDWEMNGEDNKEMADEVINNMRKTVEVI